MESSTETNTSKEQTPDDNNNSTSAQTTATGSNDQKDVAQVDSRDDKVQNEPKPVAEAATEPVSTIYEKFSHP